MSSGSAHRDRGVVEGVAGSAAYRDLLDRLKQRIRDSQAHAARTLNTELVMLYWSIGRDSLDQQQAAGWGDDVVGRIAQDLVSDVGSPRGFSRRNLFYMRRFAALWPDLEKVQTLSAQIGWSHHQALIDAFGNDPDTYAWYAAKAAENGWAVRHLKAQIDLSLHERQGFVVTTFAAALASADAAHTLQAIKDPYVFDFLELDENAHERQLEQALIEDIQLFMLELGAGFAFYGRQRPISVGGQEFFLDLIFYHHTLRRFVVIDLKIGAFKPEHVNKMNFYLNAVDAQLRVGDDQESVGIILCTQRNETVAELTLHRVGAPIAVSTWQTASSIQLPPSKAGDMPGDYPADFTQLDEVRTRLIERVARRTPEILEDQARAVRDDPSNARSPQVAASAKDELD